MDIREIDWLAAESIFTSVGLHCDVSLDWEPTFYGAFVNDRLVGAIVTIRTPSGLWCECLAVAASHRRQGVADRLWRAAGCPQPLAIRNSQDAHGFWGSRKKDVAHA